VTSNQVRSLHTQQIRSMVRHGKEPPADDATQVTTQEGR